MKRKYFFGMAVFAAILCFLYLFQIKSNPKKEEPLKTNSVDSILIRREKAFNTRIYDSLEEKVKSGDIITRMGTDITSILLAKLNPTDTSYSHCGIASVENDSLFIYHSIGGEINNEEKMKREWLYDFTKPSVCRRLGIFRPALTKNELNDLIHEVQRLYKSGLPFDLDFNLSTDEKQYCAEMVAKCFGKIWGNPHWVKTEIIDSIEYIPVENLYKNPLVMEIYQLNY